MKTGVEFRCQICQTIHWSGRYSSSKKLKRPICCGKIVALSRLTEDFCPSILCKMGVKSFCDCRCGGRYHSTLLTSKP